MLYVECWKQGKREASPTAAIIDSQSGGPGSVRMAMMRAKRSSARNRMFSYICWACCCTRSFIRATSKIAMAASLHVLAPCGASPRGEGHRTGENHFDDVSAGPGHGNRRLRGEVPHHLSDLRVYNLCDPLHLTLIHRWTSVESVPLQAEIRRFRLLPECRRRHRRKPATPMLSAKCFLLISVASE